MPTPSGSLNHTSTSLSLARLLQAKSPTPQPPHPPSMCPAPRKLPQLEPACLLQMKPPQPPTWPSQTEPSSLQVPHRLTLNVMLVVKLRHQSQKTYLFLAACSASSLSFSLSIPWQVSTRWTQSPYFLPIYLPQDFTTRSHRRWMPNPPSSRRPPLLLNPT